jgi:hypothetical protein
MANSEWFRRASGDPPYALPHYSLFASAPQARIRYSRAGKARATADIAGCA